MAGIPPNYGAGYMSAGAKLPAVTKKTTQRPATQITPAPMSIPNGSAQKAASVQRAQQAAQPKPAQITPAPMNIPNGNAISSAAVQQAQQLAASQAAQQQQAKAAQIAQQTADAARAAQLIQIAQAAAAQQKAQITPYAPGASATVSKPLGPSAPAPAPTPASYTPTQSPAQTPSTPQIATPVGGAPSQMGTFTNATGVGSGTYGQQQRMRQNRGPQTGTSITPEMLRRMALQRITSGYSS